MSDNKKPKTDKLTPDAEGYLKVGRFVIKADHLEGVSKDEFVKAHSKALRHEIYNVWEKVKPFTKAKKVVKD